jgi:hypothetical protein
MNDLFKLFPDLPCFPKRKQSPSQAMAEMQRRVQEIQGQLTRTIEHRKAASERVRRYRAMRPPKGRR